MQAKNKNGYVLYPNCSAYATLRQAMAAAKVASMREPGYARVVNCDTELAVAAYRWGDKIMIAGGK